MTFLCQCPSDTFEPWSTTTHLTSKNDCRPRTTSISIHLHNKHTRYMGTESHSTFPHQPARRKTPKPVEKSRKRTDGGEERRANFPWLTQSPHHASSYYAYLSYLILDIPNVPSVASIFPTVYLTFNPRLQSVE